MSDSARGVTTTAAVPVESLRSLPLSRIKFEGTSDSKRSRICDESSGDRIARAHEGVDEQAERPIGGNAAGAGVRLAEVAPLLEV